MSRWHDRRSSPGVGREFVDIADHFCAPARVSCQIRRAAAPLLEAALANDESLGVESLGVNVARVMTDNDGRLL